VRIRALCQAPNKQLQRTVIRRRGDVASAPFHYALAPRIARRRAAAELQRYATRMSLRDIFGVAVVIAALILAPLSITFGGMWWVVTVLLIVAGTRLYLSAGVVRREKQSGGELDDMARGHGISLRRDRGSWESDGAADGDSD
jgi:hypothetical protein